MFGYTVRSELEIGALFAWNDTDFPSGNPLLGGLAHLIINGVGVDVGYYEHVDEYEVGRGGELSGTFGISF